MKNLVINYCLNLIKKHKDVTEQELEIIKYGLVGLYLTITKLIIISIIAIIFGLFKEMIIFFILYGILRTFSYGIHATKSWMCLISSILMFNLIPYIASIFEINFIIKLIIGIVATILMFKNSPADTHKRPIINMKRRKKLKILSTSFCILYTILSLIITDVFYSNCFVYSMILQNILISPVTYKLFKLPYNNYIGYLKKHPELNNL